jgi:hypothetical protein
MPGLHPPTRSFPPTRYLTGLAVLVLTAACTGNPGATPPAPSGSAAASTLPSLAPSAVTSAAPSPSAAPSAAPSVAPAGFALTGEVLDDSRKFVVGATVTARQGGRDVATATTTANGAYSLNLPAGKYDVSATKKGLTTRTQPVELAAAATLNFGQETSNSTNPFALSDFPEIDRVDVEEAAAGGPLTLKVHLSEALGKASQQRLDENLELLAGRSTEFLKSVGIATPKIRPERRWADDQTYEFKLTSPYLASGPTAIEYSIIIRQEEDPDEQDPETRENVWNDLGIVDGTGNALGRGRMQYAFLKPQLFPFDLGFLVDPKFGYYVEDRRWRLTHDGLFTFTAKKDDVPPSLEKVSLKVRDTAGTSEADVLTLTFNEPMRVAKDRNNLEFTRLDKDLELAFLSVSTVRTGTNPTAVDPSNKIRKIVFNRDDARIVEFHYPAGTFEGKEWVEVTLGKDVLDPAGNKPDPKKLRLSGPVVGG